MNQAVDWRQETGAPEALRFRPLGLRLAAASATPELLACVAAVCEPMSDPADPYGAEVSVRLDLLEEGAETNAPIRIEAGARHLRIAGGGVEAFADGARRCGVARVPAGWLGARDRLQAEVIEPLLLFLICRADRTPLHASAVRIGDAAVLLAGPSGSGKSTLALAAWARGLEVLSEDIVHVGRAPVLRLWGGKGHVHVFPEEAPDGPVGPMRLRNGRTKRAISLGAPAIACADRAVVCILQRDRKVELTTVDQEAALAALAPMDPGFDLLRDEGLDALSALTEKGAWRLTLGPDPSEAVACLIANRDQLLARAVP